MMKFKLLILSLISLALYAKDYNIKDYGAKADGTRLNTKAIQAAIDMCTADGGGRVLIEGGSYVSGTLYLKSNVTLHIQNGATLLASPHIEDYTTDTHKNMYKNEPHMDRCFIYAKNQKNIAIEGYGTIDGNGHRANFKKIRPMMLRFVACDHIRLNNVHLVNPAAWTSAWLYCNDISVSGISIRSRVNNNGDGLDFDGCSNVRVINSNFDNSDDCICLQASRPDKACQYVTVSNCIFTTKWGGMRIGLLSRGDIHNVTVTNCTFHDIQDSGLKIQQMEGGEMRNMTFSNLVMENVPRPVFMTFCQQRACVDTPEGEYEALKRMHHMSFNNIVVDNSMGTKDACFFLTGMPEHHIEDISISNVQMVVPGGGTKEDAKKIPAEYTLETLGNWWPEFSKVGTLPAYGIYARHIDGLTLDNISIQTVGEDKRPPVVMKSVNDAVIKGIKANGKVLKEGEIVYKRPYFNTEKDLLLAQFDSKPDPDDIHAQAALGCMLLHPDLEGVNVFAVAGAIGEQNGTFIVSDKLFDLAFGQNWTAANADWDKAVQDIVAQVLPVLKNGGKVWVQEAGQSNITADWLFEILKTIPSYTVKTNVMVVQHSNWNEKQTNDDDLAYVKKMTNYFSIDDGNALPDEAWGDRGPYATPAYRAKDAHWIAQAKASPNKKARQLWLEADRVIDSYFPNGFKHEWSYIHYDGVDYSDCCENWWIFNVGSKANTHEKFWKRYVVNE